MTKVRKAVRRETFGCLYESGKSRPVIVSIEPPNLVGLRLKGTRRTYWLTAESIYMQALKADLRYKQLEKARASKVKRRARHK